jgi:hypothetical protein
MVREDRLDAELAALLWLLAAERVSVHVVGPDAAVAAAVVDAIRPLAADAALVTGGLGTGVEDVLRQPVPLRPATGAIVIVDAGGRVAAAHLLRPPLRDAAGHVRPQGPGVLAARMGQEERLEHFAWGVVPELAAGMGRKAGDVEAEIDARAATISGLAGAAAPDDAAVGLALRTWAPPSRSV